MLDSLAANTSKLRAELQDERRIWERTRGNWKKYGVKWIKEKLEAMQIQANIVYVIITFAWQLIGLSNEQITKEKVVETFNIALARNGNMPLLPNSAPETTLVTINAVAGIQEFQQLCAEVQSKLDKYNKFYSYACHTL